jgi:hypothetical protein
MASRFPTRTHSHQSTSGAMTASRPRTSVAGLNAWRFRASAADRHDAEVAPVGCMMTIDRHLSSLHTLGNDRSSHIDLFERFLIEAPAWHSRTINIEHDEHERSKNDDVSTSSLRQTQHVCASTSAFINVCCTE